MPTTQRNRFVPTLEQMEAREMLSANLVPNRTIDHPFVVNGHVGQLTASPRMQIDYNVPLTQNAVAQAAPQKAALQAPNMHNTHIEPAHVFASKDYTAANVGTITSNSGNNGDHTLMLQRWQGFVSFLKAQQGQRNNVSGTLPQNPTNHNNGNPGSASQQSTTSKDQFTPFNIHQPLGSRVVQTLESWMQGAGYAVNAENLGLDSNGKVSGELLIGKDNKRPTSRNDAFAVVPVHAGELGPLPQVVNSSPQGRQLLQAGTPRTDTKQALFLFTNWKQALQPEFQLIRLQNTLQNTIGAVLPATRDLYRIEGGRVRRIRQDDGRVDVLFGFSKDGKPQSHLNVRYREAESDYKTYTIAIRDGKLYIPPGLQDRRQALQNAYDHWKAQNATAMESLGGQAKNLADLRWYGRTELTEPARTRLYDYVTLNYAGGALTIRNLNRDAVSHNAFDSGFQKDPNLIGNFKTAWGPGSWKHGKYVLEQSPINSLWVDSRGRYGGSMTLWYRHYDGDKIATGKDGFKVELHGIQIRFLVTPGQPVQLVVELSSAVNHPDSRGTTRWLPSNGDGVSWWGEAFNTKTVAEAIQNGVNELKRQGVRFTPAPAVPVRGVLKTGNLAGIYGATLQRTYVENQVRLTERETELNYQTQYTKLESLQIGNNGEPYATFKFFRIPFNLDLKGPSGNEVSVPVNLGLDETVQLTSTGLHISGYEKTGLPTKAEDSRLYTVELWFNFVAKISPDEIEKDLLAELKVGSKLERMQAPVLGAGDSKRDVGERIVEMRYGNRMALEKDIQDKAAAVKPHYKVHNSDEKGLKPSFPHHPGHTMGRDYYELKKPRIEVTELQVSDTGVIRDATFNIEYTGWHFHDISYLAFIFGRGQPDNYQTVGVGRIKDGVLSIEWNSTFAPSAADRAALTQGILEAVKGWVHTINNNEALLQGVRAGFLEPSDRAVIKGQQNQADGKAASQLEEFMKQTPNVLSSWLLSFGATSATGNWTAIEKSFNGLRDEYSRRISWLNRVTVAPDMEVKYQNFLSSLHEMQSKFDRAAFGIFMHRMVQDVAAGRQALPAALVAGKENATLASLESYAKYLDRTIEQIQALSVAPDLQAGKQALVSYLQGVRPQVNTPLQLFRLNQMLQGIEAQRQAMLKVFRANAPRENRNLDQVRQTLAGFRQDIDGWQRELGSWTPTPGAKAGYEAMQKYLNSLRIGSSNSGGSYQRMLRHLETPRYSGSPRPLWQRELAGERYERDWIHPVDSTRRRALRVETASRNRIDAALREFQQQPLPGFDRANEVLMPLVQQYVKQHFSNAERQYSGLDNAYGKLVASLMKVDAQSAFAKEDAQRAYQQWLVELKSVEQDMHLTNGYDGKSPVEKEFGQLVNQFKEGARHLVEAQTNEDYNKAWKDALDKLAASRVALNESFKKLGERYDVQAPVL